MCGVRSKGDSTDRQAGGDGHARTEIEQKRDELFGCRQSGEAFAHCRDMSMTNERSAFMLLIAKKACRPPAQRRTAL